MSDKAITTRLRDLRDNRGVSQDVVAEACNISRVALTRYENGQRAPRIEIAARLADYYGVSVDYILGRDEQTEPIPEDEQFAEYIKLWSKMTKKDRAFILHMMRKLDEENQQ